MRHLEQLDDQTLSNRVANLEAELRMRAGLVVRTYTTGLENEPRDLLVTHLRNLQAEQQRREGQPS